MRIPVILVLLGAAVAASCGGQTDAADGSGGSGAGGGTAAAGGGANLDCPELPGPVMAKIGARCIDTTEVTQAQYAKFLSAPPTERPTPDECGWNQTVEPKCTHDPSTPDLPANCMNFCDAASYCAWAGKRLCGEAEWQDACSNAGRATFQYGNKYEDGVCYRGTLENPLVAVASYPNCHGVNSPYDQIFDMNGNAEEWVGTLSHGTNGGPNACQTRNPLFGALSLSDLNCGFAATGNCTNAYSYLSFRCCADAVEP